MSSRPHPQPRPGDSAAEPQRQQHPRYRHLHPVPDPGHDTSIGEGWADAATREYHEQPADPGHVAAVSDAAAAMSGPPPGWAVAAARTEPAEEASVDGRDPGRSATHPDTRADRPDHPMQPGYPVSPSTPGHAVHAGLPVRSVHSGRPGQPFDDRGPAGLPDLPGPAGHGISGSAAALTGPAVGQPPPPEGPAVLQTRRVGMPWPRNPYELAPPSPDLPEETPRRPDAEIDPAERPAVTDLRWAVVRRMTDITTNHAEAAWKLRYSKPVSPTVVVLLFAVPVPGQGVPQFVLRADARTWHQSDRVADPAAVLQEMAKLVYRSWRQPGFDVRAALANQPDEHWTAEELQRQPEFLGVAVSTLDTSVYGPWKRAHSRAHAGHDVPSEVLVQFADGGRLRIMRHAGRLYDRIDRQASLSLTPDGKPPLMRWEFVAALNTIWRTDPTANTWHFLAELTRTIYWGWPSWR